MAEEIVSINWGAHPIAWPDPIDGPWYFVGHWAEIEGRAECVGLEVWKGCRPSGSGYEPLSDTTKPAGLGGTDLRGFPLATILGALWENQREAWASGKPMAALLSPTPDMDEETREYIEALTRGGAAFEVTDRRPSPPEVAAVYRAAVSARTAPTKAVQNAFAVSYSTATKWVGAARKLGLLAPTTPGKPSPAINEQER